MVVGDRDDGGQSAEAAVTAAAATAAAPNPNTVAGLVVICHLYGNRQSQQLHSLQTQPFQRQTQHQQQ
jgi:hypothetical protein